MSHLHNTYKVISVRMNTTHTSYGPFYSYEYTLESVVKELSLFNSGKLPCWELVEVYGVGAIIEVYGDWTKRVTDLTDICEFLHYKPPPKPEWGKPPEI